VSALNWLFAAEPPGEAFLTGLVVGLTLAFIFAVLGAIASMTVGRR